MTVELSGADATAVVAALGRVVDVLDVTTAPGSVSTIVRLRAVPMVEVA